MQKIQHAPPGRVTPRRHYTDGPFGQIHFQEAGCGQPLLLLHQVPCTSGQFDNVYGHLSARGFRAVGIDLPGFGGSDPTGVTPTITDYACVVRPVLDALDIGKAAILGHHTGALVANEAAIALPGRIEAVVLNGPLLVTAEDRRDFLAGLHQRERRFAPKPHAAHMVRMFDNRDWLANGTLPPARLSEYVVQALTGRGAFWYGHHAAYMYDQAERLPLITQPTLILTNTGDIIHEHAARAHAVRRDFAYVALEGGGIDIVDQQPALWAGEVADFLNGALSARPITP
jgi:pimeloyl-ACP methyl ester carboxylesterase